MAIVLIPGFMLHSGLWAEVAPALAPFGPIIHADMSQDGSVQALARRVLADAPPHFGLIGFSMGGYVAREVVRTAPARVAALVLIATSARGDTPDRARRKAVAAVQAARIPFQGVSRGSIATSLHPSRAGDAALVERIRAMGARLGRDTFLRQLRMARHGDADRLGAIRCPTLVVAAAEDRLRGLAEAAELRDGIEGAAMAVIEGAGHMLPLEAPDRLMAAVAPWLRRHMAVPAEPETP